MSWSITLFRVAGSEIRIHLTFLLLLAWIGLAQYAAAGSAAALDAVLFVLAVFVCVALHELGHAAAARRYGIATPDITLLPIGGLARLSRLPEKPSEEIVIALAGPAVNVVIAVALIALGARIEPAALAQIDGAELDFITRLAAINVFLVVFNLIPAFPMDGGRVLRAVLAIWLGRGRATAVAARIGQAAAFGFGFWGLLSGNAILVFIAIFVYIAAAAEAGQVGLLEVAGRFPVERAMITAFESLPTDATIGDAADALLRTTQHEFPVVDGGGRLRGILTRQAIVAGLKAGGRTAPVLESIRAVPTLVRGRPLSHAVNLMQESGPVVGVVDNDGRLVGYVSTDNLGELMMLQTEAAGTGPWTRASG